jgi:uncharacterized protein (DUF58 family)
MKYGSQSFTKADYAATLAATLASFLMKQGDAAGLTTFADGMRNTCRRAIAPAICGASLPSWNARRRPQAHRLISPSASWPICCANAA